MDEAELPVPEHFNANDPIQVDRQQRKARQKKKAERKIIADIAATPQGREWLWNKLESCHLYATSFHSDPLKMAFAEGERNQGLKLLGELMAESPETYVLMLKEHASNG